MTKSVDARRAARLAQLEARQIEDMQAASDDAALDLPLLAEALEIVSGPLAEAEARLIALGAQLIRKSSIGGHSLTQQIDTLALLRGNLKTIGEAMSADAEAMMAAPAVGAKA